MSRAVSLAARVEQYLAERRRLGFDLRSMRYGLDSLVEHVRRTRHRGALTIEVMAAWARQARQGAGTNATWARRLRLLRPFTRWLQQFEPGTEVPDESIFGPIPGRVAPHIYRDDELVALLEAAGRIGPPLSLRGTVMQTLFGLLACTGMRISEALALVDANVDLKSGMLTIRQSKFGKSRLVPLHVTAVAALRRYRRQRDRYVRATPETRSCVERSALESVRKEVRTCAAMPSGLEGSQELDRRAEDRGLEAIRIEQPVNRVAASVVIDDEYGGRTHLDCHGLHPAPAGYGRLAAEITISTRRFFALP